MIKKTLLILLIVVTSIAIIRVITQPLILPEKVMRFYLLTQTPMGTHMDEVIKYIESNKKWKIEWIDYEDGFIHQRKWPREVVGSKSMRVELGNYISITHFFFTTYVTVYYGFDEEGKLIEIWVWKTVDGI